MWNKKTGKTSLLAGVIVMMIGAGGIPMVFATETTHVSIFSGNATYDSSQFFKEDFETGFDGWSIAEGNLSEYETQTDIVYQGDYAFGMTGTRAEESGFSGRLQYNVNIPVEPDTGFSFAYLFPSKNVSYVGYILIFSTGQWGYYFSLFYGWYENTTMVYVKQYQNENSTMWFAHSENVYDDYEAAFGEAPKDISITSISMMMGDPYFTDIEQTAYYDMIRLGSFDNVSKPTTPTGTKEGKAGVSYNYTSSATDPYEDSLYYVWDWGDGSYSDWLGPYASGENIITSHAWDKGAYAVKVKAIDDPNGDGDISDGLESVWSEPLIINMPCASATSLDSFFQWFCERFPMVFSLFQKLRDI
jgi:hypothetical protein